MCESGALEAIISTFGHERLLYGSDFPVSHARGKCVSIGDSFLWLHPTNVDLAASYADGGRVHSTLVGFEALRALKVACDNQGLGPTAVSDIFYGNAARLFGLPDAAEATGAL